MIAVITPPPGDVHVVVNAKLRELIE